MKKYLCGIAFQHELGETDEIDIYDTLEEMKSSHKCWHSCGIVEIEIEFESHPENYTYHTWVVKQNMNWGKASANDYVDPGTE